MRSDRLQKILSISFLILALIFIFALFAKIRNITLEQSIDFPYILFILLFMTILGFFFLSLYKSTRSNIIQIEGGSKIKIEEDVVESSEDDEIGSKAHDDIDSEYYIKKLIPKVTAKTNIEKYTEKILSLLAKEFNLVQGLFFTREKGSEEFSIKGKYAYFGENEPANFNVGQTIPGQVAQNKKLFILDEIPENYITILSGLGSSAPENIIFVPVLFEDETIGVIELASFSKFEKRTQQILKIMAEALSENLNKL